MTSNTLIPLLMGLCAFLSLALLTNLITGFLKKRKATQSINKLITKVKADEEARKAEISKMLQENFRYSEEGLPEEVTVFLSKEMQFYQAMVSVYGEKVNSGLESFPIYISALLEPYKLITLPKTEEEKIGLLQAEHEKLQNDFNQAEITAKELFTEYMSLHDKTDLDLSLLSMEDLSTQVQAAKESKPSEPEQEPAKEADDNNAQVNQLTQERDDARKELEKSLEVLNTVFLEFCTLTKIDIGEKQEFTPDEVLKLLPKEFDFKQVDSSAPPQG